MDRQEKRDLKQDINVSKQDNLYHMFDFLNTWIKAIFQSIITFGINSKATKECLNAFTEYRKNLIAETNLYDYLYRHSKCAENDAVGEYLQDLFQLGEDTYAYYDKLLEEILVACDLKHEHRIIREKKNFQTLIESNEFFAKLLEILIDEDDILAYLKVSKEFMDFINKHDLRTIYIDYNDENEREFIGVNYKLDENDILKDIKIYVPSIIDLNTALIYCHTVSSAFEIYKLLGKKITTEDEERILSISNLQAETYETLYHEKEQKLLPYK